MASIWVIETGEYSDYNVVGVFSSEENAKLYAASAGISEDSISEWTLDPGIEKYRQGQLRWMIWFDLEGNVSSCSADEYEQPSSSDAHVVAEDEFTKYGYRSIVWAEDYTRAIKIANERRLQASAQAPLGKSSPPKFPGLV